MQKKKKWFYENNLSSYNIQHTRYYTYIIYRVTERIVSLFFRISYLNGEK